MIIINGKKFHIRLCRLYQTLPTFTENQSHEALDEYNGNV